MLQPLVYFKISQKNFGQQSDFWIFGKNGKLSKAIAFGFFYKFDKQLLSL